MQFIGTSHVIGTSHDCRIACTSGDASQGWLARRVDLALAFVILIGVTLVPDSLGLHIPEGYIYSAMAFLRVGWGI